MAREGSHGYELEITLCKRPRDCINLALQKPPRSPSAERRREDQKKMVLEFKHKIQPELFSRQSSKVGGSICFLNMRVSEQYRERSTAIGQFSGWKRSAQAYLVWRRESQKRAPLFNQLATLFTYHFERQKAPFQTRVCVEREVSQSRSIWITMLYFSPPSIIRSPFDRLHAAESNAWLLLLASWGEVGKNRHNGNINIFTKCNRVFWAISTADLFQDCLFKTIQISLKRRCIRKVNMVW